MNFRLLRYVFLLGFVFLKLSTSFSAVEITEKKVSLLQVEDHLTSKEESNNHLILYRIANSMHSNALFFEQIEDNEEDDEVEDFAQKLEQAKLLENQFSYFIPEFDSDYLKPGVHTTPYGLRSDQPLFIVFRFIRI